MKNKNLFQKIVFISLISVLSALVGPAVLAQAAPKQEKLLNGLKILMWSDAKADKVMVRIRIHSGSAFDPQGKEGVMQMLADNIFPNEASRDFFTEDLGGNLEIVTNYDYIQINASSKPEGFLTMLETLSAAISNPTIDKETTAKLRTALVAKLKTLESDPAYIADQAVAKRLFGTFPYGRPQMGSSTSVQNIGFADLIDAKQRFLTADNATVTISGNFDKALGFKAVRRYFGSWLKSDKRVPSTFRQPDAPDIRQLQIEVPNVQRSYYRSAVVAPARNDKDYFSMQVLMKIWQDQFCYRDEMKRGDIRYRANLLRGVYGLAKSEAIARTVAELPVYSGPCYLILIKNDGSTVYPEITQAVFDTAKVKSLADLQLQMASTVGLADAWLDVDTYRLTSVEDELKRANSSTLIDIQNLVEKLRKSPTASVLVTIPRPVN